MAGLAAKHGGVEELFLIDRAQKAMQIDVVYEPDSDDEEESEEEGDHQKHEERKSEELDEPMEEKDLKNFLYDEVFVKSILDHYAEKNDDHTYVFICSFFDILLDISPTYI